MKKDERNERKKQTGDSSCLSVRITRTKSPCFNVKLLMSDVSFSFVSSPACTAHRLHCKYRVIPSGTGARVTLRSGSVETKTSTLLSSRNQKSWGFLSLRTAMPIQGHTTCCLWVLLNCSFDPSSFPAQHFLHIMAFLIISAVKDRRRYSRSPNRMGRSVPFKNLEKLVSVKKVAHILPAPCVVIQKCPAGSAAASKSSSLAGCSQLVWGFKLPTAKIKQPQRNLNSINCNPYMYRKHISTRRQFVVALHSVAS